MLCYNLVKGLLSGRDVPFDQIGPGIPQQPSGRYGIPRPIRSKVTPFPYKNLYLLVNMFIIFISVNHYHNVQRKTNFWQQKYLQYLKHLI